MIIFSPKSLLRHKRAQSSLSEFDLGTTFKRVLPEVEKLNDKKVKRVVLCTGKVYYDLLEAREDRGITDVALVRVEQLYPFPHNSIVDELQKYPNAEVIWAQEEPKNMGAWQYIDRRLEGAMVDAKSKTSRPDYVGRSAAAASACGYMRIHQKEQAQLIDDALSV